ncbi:hypothetical protein [Deminuibacter soli]|uniref:DUF2029 domain-containing protein n=1 Tax=Deminuibacter soli TaxID=2291815 RepID=A0A3E1NQH9_9BACT|nr:hypothetical protein [Deminuibacter soli]RFM30170.1 hypothetical protein DXN05_04135 [Deminuibacter soli]
MIKKLFFVFCISLLAMYPIYKNFYNGRAVLTYQRHIALINGNSEYYNPWQYRMLSPEIIEGLMWVYNHTVDKVYPIEEKFHFQLNPTSNPTPETVEFFTLLQTRGALKYTVVFILFRFCLNFLVLSLAFLLWQKLVRSRWLKWTGLIIVSLAMGNGVIASDLVFSTYLDNVFYLLTAIIIVYNKNPRWLLLIVPLAAFNRETSLLIPFLFFVSMMDFSQFSFKRFNLAAIRFPAKQVWLLTSILYVLFFSIFIAVRVHYGYRPPQIWKVPAGIPMLKLNLLSSMAPKSYFELLGVMSIIPLIIIYQFKRFPLRMRVWFLALVPIWFAVHCYTVVAYQTRIFLVPLIIILVPMLLWLIENDYQQQDTPEEPAAGKKSSRQLTTY